MSDSISLGIRTHRGLLGAQEHEFANTNLGLINIGTTTPNDGASWNTLFATPDERLVMRPGWPGQRLQCGQNHGKQAKADESIGSVEPRGSVPDHSSDEMRRVQLYITSVIGVR